MQLFQKVNMASETIDSYMRSGIVYSSNTAVAAHAGDLVVPTGILTNAVYNAPDENMFKFTAPTAADDNLFILDPVKVPEATNGDLVYRMGVRTLGLAINAGELVAARKLALNDQFLVGLDNIEKSTSTDKVVEADLTVGTTLVTVNGFNHKVYAPESTDTALYVARVDAIRKISQGVGTKGLETAVLLTVTRI